MARNILDLTSEEALDFFAQSEEYHTYELPEYIGFNDILDFVREKLEGVTFEECMSTDPSEETNINMDLVINKDGRYGVRPLTLANPYLYWLLVKELCGAQGWKMTQECFQCFKVDNIESSALPVVKDEEDGKEAFPNATAIMNWWTSYERRTTQLALDYRYMFITDITNCYGSFDPRTIEWAFNRKNTAHQTDKHSDAARRVCKIIAALQNGRNIGVPQGSTIFNLLGEIILGYADLRFTEAVRRAIDEGRIHSDDYRVLRYRDDYRVLCNDRDDLKTISRILQDVLESLNLRLNPSKTRISEDIVRDSIKPDKLYYIENTPVFNKKGCDFDGLQKYLYFILMFGRKFPNSGTLNVLLSNLDERVKERLESKKIAVETESDNPRKGKVIEIEDFIQFLDDFDKDDSSEEDIKESKVVARWKFDPSGAKPEKADPDKDNSQENNESEKESDNSKEEDKSDSKEKYITLRGHILEDATALASVAVQIAIENVQKVHYALRVISRVVNSVEDEQLRWEIFDKVSRRLRNRPHSDYDQIWLQNITYQRDKKEGLCPYNDVRLCQLVMGDDEVELWNISWLKDEYTKDFPLDSICDRERLKKLSPVITFRETRALYDMDCGTPTLFEA